MARRSLPLLLGLLLLALSVPAVASPCARSCGTVTAEPFTSSSTAEGFGGGAGTVWTHCIHTKYPHTTNCESFGPSPAYAGTVLGPPAACAKGALYADGVLIAESLWVC